MTLNVFIQNENVKNWVCEILIYFHRIIRYQCTQPDGRVRRRRIPPQRFMLFETPLQWTFHFCWRRPTPHCSRTLDPKNPEIHSWNHFWDDHWLPEFFCEKGETIGHSSFRELPICTRRIKLTSIWYSYIFFKMIFFSCETLCGKGAEIRSGHDLGKCRFKSKLLTKETNK